jgi:hypothetical protein
LQNTEGVGAVTVEDVKPVQRLQEKPWKLGIAKSVELGWKGTILELEEGKIRG